MPINVVNIPYGNKNPYQNMLYSACKPEFCLIASRSAPLSAFAKADFQPDQSIIHIHWDDRLFPTPETEEQASDFRATCDGMRQYQANGGRLIWTIHNQFAHSEGFKTDYFRNIRQELADIVDLVHVHTPHARQHMIDDYGTDPEKLRLIPHPSYLGVYEPAEQTLKRPLPLRERTHFLSFGTMRGSRELGRLGDAAKKLTSRGHDFQVSVVGRVYPSGRRLMRRLRSNRNTTVMPERIPDSEIAQVFANAHAYMLPSTTTFTSGTAMLAQTFGLPIIGPDIDAHKHITPEACHDLLYPAQNPRGLIRMMMRVLSMSDEELAKKRQACLDFAVERSPHRISGDLKRALSELT